jgi:hypothetical protein
LRFRFCHGGFPDRELTTLCHHGQSEDAVRTQHAVADARMTERRSRSS